MRSGAITMAQLDTRTAEVGHLCVFDAAEYAELVKRMSFIVEIEMKTSCKECLYKYLLQSAACVALADTEADKLDNLVQEFLSAASSITNTVRNVIEEDVEGLPERQMEA